jgi:hypothetical protein
MTKDKPANGFKSFENLAKLSHFIKNHPGYNQKELAVNMDINLATMNRMIQVALKYDFAMLIQGKLFPGRFVNNMYISTKI